MPNFSRQRRVRPGYWFAAKQLGFGATPANAKGWAAIVVYVAALAVMQLLLHGRLQHGASIVVLTAAFALVCWRKTDGGWHWRAGNPD